MIRPFEPGDALAAVALIRALMPTWVTSERGLRHWVASSPERAKLATLVAAEGGDLVGWAEAFLRTDVREEGVSFLWAGVRPDARGRGIGSALYERAEKHLAAAGARRLETQVLEDEAGERFARARGFRRARSERCWALDPRTVDAAELAALTAEKAGEGYRLVPLGELRDRPRELFALYSLAAADAPSDHGYDESYENWERTVFACPDLDPDGSYVVLAGEKPVAFAWIAVDREGGRATHFMTGTLREFRRRGLARLAKLATIGWAAENGVTALLTENDTENGDMLALNEHLGYRPTAELRILARDL